MQDGCGAAPLGGFAGVTKGREAGTRGGFALGQPRFSSARGRGDVGSAGGGLSWMRRAVTVHGHPDRKGEEGGSASSPRWFHCFLLFSPPLTGGCLFINLVSPPEPTAGSRRRCLCVSPAQCFTPCALQDTGQKTKAACRAGWIPALQGTLQLSLLGVLMGAADFPGHYFIACGAPCDSRHRCPRRAGRGDLRAPDARQEKRCAERLLCLLQRQALSSSQSQEGEQMVTCFRQ